MKDEYPPGGCITRTLLLVLVVETSVLLSTGIGDASIFWCWSRAISLVGVDIMCLLIPSSWAKENDDFPPGGAWRRVVDLSVDVQMDNVNERKVEWSEEGEYRGKHRRKKR